MYWLIKDIKEYLGCGTNKASYIRHIAIKEFNGQIKYIHTNDVADYTSSWMIEDVAWDYGAGYRDFNYKDNKFVLTVNADSAQFSTDTTVPDLNLSHNLKPAIKRSVSLSRPVNSNDLYVYGTYNSKNPVRHCPHRIFLQTKTSPKVSLRGGRIHCMICLCITN